MERNYGSCGAAAAKSAFCSSRSALFNALYHAAGNHCAGIAGGLGAEIVRMLVDDDGAADDLIKCETVGEECGPRDAAAAEQRREIARMERVGAFRRIIVSVCVCERFLRGAGAGSAAVQVEAVKIAGAFSGCKRKPLDGGLNENALRASAKPYKAAQIRV